MQVGQIQLRFVLTVQDAKCLVVPRILLHPSSLFVIPSIHIINHFTTPDEYSIDDRHAQLSC